MRLPIPAYLLALSYFFLSLLSLSMLVGLRTKRTRLLLAWILINLLVICPEAGMVLFMAVYYWVSFDPFLTRRIVDFFFKKRSSREDQVILSVEKYKTMYLVCHSLTKQIYEAA